MKGAELAHTDAGRYRVTGPLVFGTVGALLASSTAAFDRDAPRVIDLSGVTSGDSAGLALLIEWMALAHSRGHTVQFIGTPAQLTALAKISDIDRVLSLSNAA